jgi:hypothetical protein
VTKGFATGGAAFGCVSDVFDNSSGRGRGGRGGLEATLVTSAKFVECGLEKQSVSGYDNLMIMINMVTNVLSLNLFDEVATSLAVRFFLSGAGSSTPSVFGSFLTSPTVFFLTWLLYHDG